MTTPSGTTLLAIDTATRTGSVAIGVDGHVRAEAAVGIEARHSEALLPAIVFILERAGIAPDGLDGIVVGAGPGSFTGVRIAAATAKGMAWALDVPLLSYSSLEAMAVGACAGPRPVCSLFDARRDDVYAACYDFTEATTRTLIEPFAGSIDELVERAMPHAPLFTGDGAAKHEVRITRAGGDVACGPAAYPRAAALLWLAAHDPGRGRVTRPTQWQPDYIKAPGALPMK